MQTINGIIAVVLYSRYGDIIVIPDTGWFVTSRSQQYSSIRVRNGEHGYDNNAETMKVSIIKCANYMIKLFFLNTGFYGCSRTCF